MNKGLVSLGSKAVGMTMGMVVFVLGIVGTTPIESKMAMLGIGLFALGLAALNEQ